MTAPAGPGLSAHSFRRGSHELRCVVEAAGESREIWVRSSLDEPPGADAIVPLVLIPAMALGGPVEIEAPVDETLVRRVPEIQAVLRAFQLSGDWTPATPLKHEFELVCPLAPTPARRPDRGVATCFSGGVDSFSALQRNPEIDHLLYIAGMDAPVGAAYDEHHRRARGMVARTAEQLGLPLIEVQTNARDLYAHMGLVGPAFGGGILGAAARAIAPAIARLYIASSQSYRWLLENSSHPILDPLWGRGALEVIHDGAELSRAEKLEQICGDELARSTLRVCWEGTGTDYNCCRCEKCLRTMVALEALGSLERFEAFPEPLDLEAVARARPAVRHELAYWIENLELAVARQASADLVGAIEAAIANAGRGGLPTPRRSALPNPKAPDGRTLYLDPSARVMLEGSRAAVFLVGGYDGEGGYGDLLEHRAAIEALDALGDGVAVLTVISLERVDARRSQIAAGAALPGQALVFAPEGAAAESAAANLGLIPASLPPTIETAVTYFYGGDYLDRRRADRGLVMAEAVDGLARRAGVDSRSQLSSGLAIEPDWARAAGVRWRSLLERMDRFRVRDPVSLAAASHLAGRDGRPSPTLSGDDTVGVIARAATAGGERREHVGGALRINLELRQPGIAPDGRSEAIEFGSRLVVGIASTSGSRVTVQPVALPGGNGAPPPASPRHSMFATLEPLTLDPLWLESQVSILRRADLTVAFSHHLALTSLILGVPAAIPYGIAGDARSAQGLQRDFSLPAELVPSLTVDPDAAAAAVVALIGDEAAAAELRVRLDAGGRRAIARRAKVEEELVATIEGGIEPANPASGGFGEPAAEDYRRLLTAYEELARRLDRASSLASARQASLDRIARSASWRWTAPIRGARRALRRR